MSSLYYFSDFGDVDVQSKNARRDMTPDSGRGTSSPLPERLRAALGAEGRGRWTGAGSQPSRERELPV